MMDFCCQIVATRDFDRLKTLILRGFQDFSLYSRSMQSNAFCLIYVSPVRSRDSDSTNYLYSPCSYSLSLSFLYQRDKEAVLPWIAGIIPLESLYCLSDCQSI